MSIDTIPSITSIPLPSWANLRVIRVRVTIDHTTPFDRQYTQEISLVNKGTDTVNEILIPIPEFLHGLKVLDEDNSLLSFYSVREIEEKIMNYDLDLRENIRHQLEAAHLLWVRIPQNNLINPDELRTIRLTYVDSCDVEIVRYSIFDIPQYDDNIFIPQNTIEQYYFINAPKDYVIEIDSRTSAYTTPLEPNVVPEKIDIKYLKDMPSNSDFKGECIDIRNHNGFVTARFPNRDQSYALRLYYQIKLAKMERHVWRIVLPTVGTVLLFLALLPALPIHIDFLNSQTLVAIGGAVSSVSGALIALITNPLIRRTRLLLFIHLGLAICIILGSGFIHNTESLHMPVQNGTATG